MTTSLLEALNDDRTVVDGARFVDYFSGDSLKSWWTIRNIQGSNTYLSHNSIDGGLAITTGAINNDIGQIDFNDIKQFDPANAVMTVIAKCNESTSRILKFELGDQDTRTQEDPAELLRYIDDTRDTFIRLTTSLNETSTVVDTVISSGGTGKNLIRLEGFSGSATLSMNDSLVATSTTNLAVAISEPKIKARTLTTASRRVNLTYCEVWNK